MWAMVSGVAHSRLVCVSAFVNLPLHYKVQKFFSGTGSPGWSRKKGRKTVVVWWWYVHKTSWACLSFYEYFTVALVRDIVWLFHWHKELCVSTLSLAFPSHTLFEGVTCLFFFVRIPTVFFWHCVNFIIWFCHSIEAFPLLQKYPIQGSWFRKMLKSVI